jgi:hypothetical protein
MPNDNHLINVPDLVPPSRIARATRSVGRWLLSNLAAVAALVVAGGALYASMHANDIAKQAKVQAARTSLAIEPEAIPTSEPPLADFLSRYGVTDTGPRYMLIVGADQKLLLITWATVRNSGTNEARDIKLQAKIEFELPPTHADRLAPITAQFTIGDLAPGQARSQDIHASLTFDHVQPSTTKTFQKLFEEDTIRGKLTLTTSYTTPDGDRVESGKFVGTTSSGGGRIGAQSVATSEIARFVQKQASSAAAK